MKNADADSKPTSVVKYSCVAMLVAAGLLVAHHADVRIPWHSSWNAKKTVGEKLSIVTSELATLPTPVAHSDPGYSTQEQILLRTRSFVMNDKRDRYQAAVNGAERVRPPATTAEAKRRELHLRRMHDGIKLIKGYRDTANGFSKRQIEWIHNLPVFICWYEGKYLGAPAVFFFDIDSGRWIWNYGAATAGKHDQLEYAITGGDPAIGKIDPGLLSRRARVGLANEILTGLARINETAVP